MPFDTIQKIWPKRDKKPGTVVFQGGQKFSTFSDAILKAADDLVGQLVEYTTEQKGEYTNLASVKPASRPGNTGALQQADPAKATASVGVADVVAIGSLVAAIKEHAAAIREMAAEYRKVAVSILTSGAKQEGGVATTELREPAVNVDEMQKTLAKTVGEDAAEAMFSAIRKKHSKSAEKLQAAAVELLKAHNITAEAA